MIQLSFFFKCGQLDGEKSFKISKPPFCMYLLILRPEHKLQFTACEPCVETEVQCWTMSKLLKIQCWMAYCWAAKCVLHLQIFQSLIYVSLSQTFSSQHSNANKQTTKQTTHKKQTITTNNNKQQLCKPPPPNTEMLLTACI